MRISLQLPTFNRHDQLLQSLSRLTELTIPDEILVIDDGGTDETAMLCGWFADRLPLRYLYHDRPGVGCCTVPRNIGIRNTDCELVLITEPEILFVTDIVAQLRDAWDGVNVQSVKTWFDSPSLGCLSPEQCVKNEDWHAHTCANLYARDWLTAVGGYHEDFPGVWGWDDTDMFTRLRISGHGEILVPGTEVLHQWHGTGRPDQIPNHDYFFSRSYMQEPKDHDLRDLVANKGREWGHLTPRS